MQRPNVGVIQVVGSPLSKKQAQKKIASLSTVGVRSILEAPRSVVLKDGSSVLVRRLSARLISKSTDKVPPFVSIDSFIELSDGVIWITLIYWDDDNAVPQYQSAADTLIASLSRE